MSNLCFASELPDDAVGEPVVLNGVSYGVLKRAGARWYVSDDNLVYLLTEDDVIQILEDSDD